MGCRRRVLAVPRRRHAEFVDQRPRSGTFGHGSRHIGRRLLPHPTSLHAHIRLSAGRSTIRLCGNCGSHQLPQRLAPARGRRPRNRAFRTGTPSARTDRRAGHRQRHASPRDRASQPERAELSRVDRCGARRHPRDRHGWSCGQDERRGAAHVWIPARRPARPRCRDDHAGAISGCPPREARDLR